MVAELNPFVFVNPVNGNNFINRQTQLSTLFSNIYNEQNSVFYNLPGFGCTSLLKYFDDQNNLNNNLPERYHGKIFTVYINLKHFSEVSKFKVSNFWKKIIDTIEQRYKYPVLEFINEKNQLTHQHLEKVFHS